MSEDKKIILQEPIAIVGMACLYPGAINLAKYWGNILSKKDLFTEVPKTHWLLDDYYHPDPRVRGKTYCNKGAFLPEVAFDFAKFGMPPNTLPHTDAAQLLGLVVAEALLQDAFGGNFSKIDREKIAVILGFSLATTLSTEAQTASGKPIWLKALRNCGIEEEKIKEIYKTCENYYLHLNENTFPGFLQNVIAGRIANRFDLHGTNCVIDAACASSLGAFHMSIKELISGESDLVLTGGLQTITNPLIYLCFSKTPALSFSGNCRPFDEKADGTMLGEGVGFFALRRLEDAERDGNQIYAVIRGIGSSSDGKGKSIYAPEATGQIRALRRAYQKAGFKPKTVELVEAHGTGTMAGDAAELKTLCTVFSEGNGEEKQWCALGSIKSQIGHTLGSAGAASMMKTVLALQHKVLPPTLHVNKPTDIVDLPSSPFYLNTEPRPWIHRGEHPRRAAVSSFGFGGTNFHVVLEEYRGPGVSPQRRDSFPEELILVSGNHPEELLQKVRQLGQAHQEGQSLFSLSKQAFEKFSVKDPLRLALVVSSAEDLRNKLPQIENALAKDLEEIWLPPLGIYFQRSFQVNKIAFLFPGQGSQYLNMGAELAMHLDAFRHKWDQGDGVVLDPKLRLSRVVFPPPVFSAEEGKGQEAQLTATEWAQPALGMSSAAMLSLLEQMELKADFAAGHSFGEISALHYAGSFDLKTCLQIARKRGELMAQASQQAGGMLAVAGEASRILKILQELGSEVLIANDNAPDQCVLSGATEDLSRVRQRLEMEGFKLTPLAVSTAFHSPLVWDSTVPFQAFLDTLDIQTPRIPVYSNTHVMPYPEDPKAIKAQLAQHLTKPVRFREEIEALHQAGTNLFIEVGPSATLTGLVKKCLGDKRHLAINLDQKKKHGVSSLLNAIGQMCAAGVPLKLNFLFERNLPVKEGTEKGPSTVMLSGVTFQKRYPIAGEDIGLQRMSIDPEIELGPSTGLNKVLDLAFAKDKREISAKAVGSDLLPNLTPKEPTRNQGAAQPYALRQMPAAPTLAAPIPTPVLKAPEPITPTAATPTSQDFKPKGGTEVKSDSAHLPIDQADVEKLKNIFLEVISEKTGYPQEIINPTMDLEADLGIDSIKRVEIFMTMRERVPELPEVPLQDLATLQSIDQIVRYMMERGEAMVVASERAVAPTTSQVAVKPEVKEPAPVPTATRPEPSPTALVQAPVTPPVAPPPAKAPMSLSDIPDYLLPDPRTAAYPIKVRRYGLKPQGYALSSKVALAPNRKVFVVDAGSGIGEALAKSLTDHGVPALAFAGEEGFALSQACGGVVYLGGLRPLQHLYAGVKLNKEAFRLAKLASSALPSAIAEGGGWWISVQDTGGNFGLSGNQAQESLRGGLAGLTKSLAQEWKGLYAKAIDIPVQGIAPDEAAKRIAEEILKGGSAFEVGLPQAGQRITLAMEEIAYAPAAKPWLDENSVLVVSGGARGITASGVLALAKAFKPKIVLFGRSPVLTEEPEALQTLTEEKDLKRAILETAQRRGEHFTPHVIDDQVRRILQSREIRKTIQQLNDAGSPVKYYAVDILESRLIRTEGPQWTWKAGSLVRAALAEVRGEWGPIHGLIHGAGVIQDKFIQDKTPEQFDLVFDTKVLGLTELLNALEQDPLRVILLYSSLAARFGNRGQCDYAMANEVLNKIAWGEQVKRGEACLVKSLNWGPWEGGMVNPTLQGFLKKVGVPMIPIALGTEALVSEVKDGSTQAVEVMFRAERERPSRRRASEAAGNNQAFIGEYKISTDAKGHTVLQGTRIFDPEQDTWLQDHCPTFVIPTLPLTGMMATMREAAERLCPDAKVIGFADFRASHWLEFSLGAQEVQITGEIEKATKDQTTVKVALKQFREAPKAELSRWEPFCMGRVLMATEFPASPEGPRFIREKTIREFIGKELYQSGFRFHGPQFQKLLKVILHSQMKGTSFIETTPRGPNPSSLAWTLFMDAVAQSMPHEESQPWMEQTSGRVGFPLGVEQVQFFREWPEAPHLRCEFELLSIEQEGRLPKFEIRVFDGEGERAPLWAKLIWNEVLIDLGLLARISPQDRVSFLRDRKPFPQWSLSQPLNKQTSLISLKDLKSYDWLPGTMARVYLSQEELEQYHRLKADEAAHWLAPRVAAKEWVAKLESIHPAAVHIQECGDHGFLAVSSRRPVNQIPFTWDFNGTVYRVEQNGEEGYNRNPITAYYSKIFNEMENPLGELVTGIGEKFCKELVFEDAEDFQSLSGKPVLYLANHQTFIESFLFSACLSSLGQIPIVGLAKKEHRELWLGQFEEIYLSYPRFPGDSRMLFIDRENPNDMLQTFAQIKNELLEQRYSLLVHVEGKRSRRANQPVKKITNVLLDLSLEVGVPIIPVRFRGALPLTEVDPKRDFPDGFGKQSCWMGKSIRPAHLEGLPYAERAIAVREAINHLGGLDNEFPESPDVGFAQLVQAWRTYTGCAEAPAALFLSSQRLKSALKVEERVGIHRVADPWERFLLAGRLGLRLRRPTALILPNTDIGRWIGKFAQWVFASGGPKVFFGEEPGPSFEIIFKGNHE